MQDLWCCVRFPETKGTVFYNKHLTEEQIIMISKCKAMLDDHLGLYQCYYETSVDVERIFDVLDMS